MTDGSSTAGADWVSPDWGPAQERTPTRLLLVGANQRWTKVVAAAAARLGAAIVDSVGDSHAALARILTASEPYSLVLLQARRDDHAVDDLADLTFGDAGSRTGLLLLGDTGRQPPGSIVVEQPTRAALSRALSRHPWQAEKNGPALTRDEMIAALNGPMLKLRYQPIIRLSDQKPIGLEVLSRLDHAERGMLSGEQFIPQMEAAGLAQKLTGIMITQALHEICRHGLIELGLCIGLNMPLNVLLMDDTVELLESQREKCAIPADNVVVELTETQPVRDLVTLRRAVGRLREIGYRVAIDDAIPAMANVTGLLEMGFTTLKFDKSVVRRAAHDQQCRDFIKAGVALTDGEIKTVAEGIEDGETRALMRELGVNSGQGYHFGRPLPAGAVKLWLDNFQGC